MLQTWSKKVFKCLTVLSLLITCVSCKALKPIKIGDYLIELAYLSGIEISQEIDSCFNSLKDWKIVNDEDYKRLEDDLDYGFLTRTICSLLNIDTYDFENQNFIKKRKETDLVDDEEAKSVIRKAVIIINNPEFENEYEINEKEDIEHLSNYELNDNYLKTKSDLEVGDIVYLQDDEIYKKVQSVNNNGYVLIDPDLDDILNGLYIQGTGELNLDEAEIIPYEDDEEITGYVNNRYDLLAVKRKSFTKNGYRVAYSVNSSSLDVRISKTNKDKLNMFFDISLSNIKPTYKWKYENSKVEEAFLKVDFKLTNELGFSTGKYDKYYLDFKDLDASSFKNAINSIIKPKDDELECTIPICTIKTPIPEIPTCNFNIDVLAKIYVTGRVEIVLYNSGTVGFEAKDGNFRIINDVEKDSDFIVGGSARGVVGVNFNLESNNLRLMDVEFDGGVRASVKSTLHLYDSSGKDNKEESDIPYSILHEITKENKDVRVCGDVSLNWVFDITFNTSKALLYKYGLTYQKTLLDSKDQIFNNLTHIENFQFVKKCTRKNRLSTQTNSYTPLNSNKIVLDTYSKVIVLKSSYNIPIIAIPKGYSESDLLYSSNDSAVASVNNGIVFARSIGSCRIEVKTKDDKYKAYINILVSTG